ncbi:MAG: menaquinone biosynthetic enzyme MqnA/MqnD family protein [Candidatus Rokuibacteriota bacterium]
MELRPVRAANPQSPLRVGRISYLNVEPFFHAFPWPLTTGLPPRALAKALAEGEVDAGPLPLADCVRLEPALTLLPYGIATRERAQSVFLFSRRPIRELAGQRVAVTGETSTSVQLLRILLAFRDEVAPPVLVHVNEPAEALLLIGDAALAARGRVWPYPSCFDLGEEWTRWTGLPCVFAVWGVRADAPPDAPEALGAVLAQSLEAGLQALPAIARARRDLGLSEAEVVAYLEGFSYRIGPDEQKAMAEFRRFLALLPA